MERINLTLLKISRICGYLLFIIIFLYIISGYGMLKGFLDYSFGKWLHETFLPIPLFFTYLFHGLIQIKFVLKRKGFKDDLFLNLFLLAVGLILLILFLYFYLC